MGGVAPPNGPPNNFKFVIKFHLVSQLAPPHLTTFTHHWCQCNYYKIKHWLYIYVSVTLVRLVSKKKCIAIKWIITVDGIASYMLLLKRLLYTILFQGRRSGWNTGKAKNSLPFPLSKTTNNCCSKILEYNTVHFLFTFKQFFC